ncbi:glycosyltransferase family 2 protein [bacterium]|nr:glycosyltransferase family 2 protein [bacterium]MCP5462583.1 glycosyltransferase family 2 protein [bacterium]
MSSEYCFTNIIILNYNGKPDTMECLQSLAADKSLANIKVILINNSSDEQFSKQELTSFPFPVRYMPLTENKGFCRGNNLGIAKSLADPECKFIMLLNNDTIVPSGTIQRLRAVCEQHPRWLLNPLIAFHYSGKVQCTGGKWNLLTGLSRNFNKGKLPEQITEDITPYYLNGCCIYAHRSVFDDIGGFDRNFFTYCEDLDLSYRAKRRKYVLRVIHDAIVYHKHSKSSQPLLKHYYICRNTALFVMKHFPLLSVLVLPIHYFFQLIAGIHVYKTLNPFKLFYVVTKGFSDGIDNTWSLERIRKLR